MKKDKIVNLIKYILLIISAIIFEIIPFWLLLVTSFKPYSEASKINLNLPIKWSLIQNYLTVFEKGQFLRGFLNSFIVTVVSVISVLILSSFAGWIFARIKSRITNILYFICIGGILVPVAIITCLKIFIGIHIYGGLPGLIIFYIGAFMSFSIFFITGFIKTIPKELEEAARIDGCTNLGVFFRIIFPLLGPVLSTLTIFLTLSAWNDFMNPLYFLRSSKSATLAIGLYNFISQYYRQVRWDLVFADVIMVSLPLLIIFFFLQKRILSGIIGGAIKQ